MLLYFRWTFHTPSLCHVYLLLDIGSNLLQFSKTPIICIVTPVIKAQTPDFSSHFLLLIVFRLLEGCVWWDFRFLVQHRRLGTRPLVYYFGKSFHLPVCQSRMIQTLKSAHLCYTTALTEEHLEAPAL